MSTQYTFDDIFEAVPEDIAIAVGEIVRMQNSEESLDVLVEIKEIETAYTNVYVPSYIKVEYVNTKKTLKIPSDWIMPKDYTSMTGHKYVGEEKIKLFML